MSTVLVFIFPFRVDKFYGACLLMLGEHDHKIVTCKEINKLWGESHEAAF